MASLALAGGSSCRGSRVEEVLAVVSFGVLVVVELRMSSLPSVHLLLSAHALHGARILRGVSPSPF